MQALAEEWKKRDIEREVLVKKKVRKLVLILAESLIINLIIIKFDKIFTNY